MANELSERFISAFSRLEDELRRITGSTTHESFTFMLDHASRSSTAFAHYRDDLREFAELRNAIVHRRIGDQPIAEPHPDIVAQIESIADIVTQAPTLKDHFSKHVATCSPQDNVKHVLELFLKGKFNQAPVYNGKRLVGLLTSDAISLWLADTYSSSDWANPLTKVQALLTYTSTKDDYVVLRGSQNIFDALEAFDTAYERGRHLKAIILTEDGSVNLPPLGIITMVEVPLLIRLVNPEPLAPITPHYRRR
jgi:CBS domain-containing protein